MDKNFNLENAKSIIAEASGVPRKHHVWQHHQAD